MKVDALIEPDPPVWVRDAVFYQIFPDRFAISHSLAKPGNLESWLSDPTEKGYKGGDLVGIVEHLDYLDDLGVNALYLNPIFQSACNHRYHTYDYFKVDPLLGGDAALRLLVEAAHRRGIRLILDGVFNHASRGFFQFNDILENGPASPWVDWFIIEEWPLAAYDTSRPANYACWWNNRALPKFNTSNGQAREFLMTVAEYWIGEFDIDGWRLDVPDEIQTPGFWEEFRGRVRSVREDAYIVGELWDEAPEWLRGDRFDASMNYQLAAAIIAFSAGQYVNPNLGEGRAYKPYPQISGTEFGKRVQRLLSIYSWDTTLAQFNLLGSHDTARLITLAGGNRDAVKLATLLQMTLPGVPCVYYGDEIGLAGNQSSDAPFRDSDSRRAFPWQHKELWDLELLTYTKAAISLRNENLPLRQGSFRELVADQYCYAFARTAGEQTLVITVNSAEDTADLVLDQTSFPGGRVLTPVLGVSPTVALDDGVWNLSVPPRTGLVLRVN